MRPVYILGVFQLPVSKAEVVHLGSYGAEVVRGALVDGDIDPARVEALFVGNMLAPVLSNQQQLGSLIADYAGLPGIEALTVEAACGSGAAAVRQAFVRVASGMSDVVVACGVEAMTLTDGPGITRALAAATDWELEGSRGATFVSLNAQLMRAYIERHGVSADAFAGFSLNAHRNAMSNPYAFLRKGLSADGYRASREIDAPLRLFDVSPVCNGAAAVVLGSLDASRALAGRPRVRVVASTAATDAPAIARRTNPTTLAAVTASTSRALREAGLSHDDVDLFELHDAYSIMAVMSLEAAGFAKPGDGVLLGTPEHIGLTGDLPIATFGGLKARGHPVGATGVYQVIEAHAQLVGAAGANQVPGAENALVQNIGGVGTTVVSHVLRREA